MIDQQMAQILKILQQKNNQSADAPYIPQQQMGNPPSQINSSQTAPSLLGFLGGLGDSKNSQGGIDPGMLTRINQFAMKQMGQGDGNQPFPWQQQPVGQQIGQSTQGGLLKLLSFLG